MSKRNDYRLLTVFAFSIVLTFGIIMNLKAQVNPLIQDYYGINYSRLGLIFSTLSTGSIITTFYGGRLIQNFGLKKVIFSGLSVVGVGLAVVNYSITYNLLLVAMFIIGLGLGLLNVSNNSLASLLFVKNRGRMMNIFHLFFGVGGMLAPIYANGLFNLGGNWKSTYFFVLLIIIPLLMVTFKAKFPKLERDKKEPTSFFKLLGEPKILIFALIFLLYVGLEIGIASWLGVYLNDVQGRSEGEIGFYLAIFFFLFTFGRLVASFIVEKVGYFKMVFISATLGGLSFFLGLVGPEVFTIFFSMVGLWIAPIFPTMQAIIFETFEEDISAIIGLILTFGALGDVIIANWFTGLLNDLLGIRLGYGGFLVYIVLLIFLLNWLRVGYLNQDKVKASN
ncbi:MFS transporter [Halonatronum saccharophilum]|uniref:MFS transporter n=1 Tax=Halonatronum saccharophilum TaxID=150060 RepID=UPI0004855A39|nr:MFS transporter [Halonatronum saccharophilum]